MNVIHFDDTTNQDEWQKEVYSKAKELFDTLNLNKVLDVGCGSAYKLTHHFAPHEAHGVEVEPTLSHVTQKYPNYKFSSLEKLKELTFDLVVISDVIEHVPAPDKFFSKILLHCNSHLIISTPARELIPTSRKFGPPNNPSHYREWSSAEFRAFIAQYCDIEDQYISNAEQFTQVIIARKK